MDTGLLGTLLKTIDFNKKDKLTPNKEAILFLKTLRTTKCQPSNNTVTDILKPKILNEVVDEIFEHARNNFPIEEDSIIQTDSSKKPGIIMPIIPAYHARFYLNDKKISVFDSLYDSTSVYKEALFSKYKEKIQLILINIYKITFVYDVLKFLNIRATIEESIFTIFTLTSSFASDNSTSPNISNNFFTFLKRLEDPPDWFFCKAFFDNLRLCFVLERGVKEEVCLYNKNYYDDNLYILVEFENTSAIYLKSIMKV